MAQPLDLKPILEDCLGSSLVYFEPPPNFAMQYPCIIYQLADIKSSFADNTVFNIEHRYSVTVIDANPLSEIPDRVAHLPKCVFDRPFVSDNLHHYVFNIFF